MTLWWIGNAVLLLVVVPILVVLLHGVLGAARRTRAAVDAIAPVAAAASNDLDAVEDLKTTQTQVHDTIGVVANYGGSLDVILDDV